LVESFAAISLTKQTVLIDLERIERYHLGDYAVEILAHEIGHHVLAPATFADHLRCLVRVRTALPTLERFAPRVANLYTDLLINDRLARSKNLRMADIFRQLHLAHQLMMDVETASSRFRTTKRKADPLPASRVWTLYLRIMELLWGLPKGDLGSGPTDDHLEGDAWLGSRVVRVYAQEWLTGASRFASLLLPYLVEDENALAPALLFGDTQAIGEGGGGSGASAIVLTDPAEQPLHPAHDPLIDDGTEPIRSGRALVTSDQNTASEGQHRPPFEFGEVLRSAGLEVDEHDAAILYYRALAQPHLVPFPRRKRASERDPLPEGLEGWSVGDPLDELDWFSSVSMSPTVVPGLTTVKRQWGTSDSPEASWEPVDLDIYVDSSGSMPNPQQIVSFPALAGAVVCLSALRAGASVQATLWSGPGEVLTTGSFVRNPTQILRVLTGYFGGSTQFPLHVLRQTYAPSVSRKRPVHILHVSDLGIDTMWHDSDTPERGDGWSARQALARAGGGGTLALLLFDGWEDVGRADVGRDDVGRDDVGIVKRLRDEEGWDLHDVRTMEDLLAFGKAFARRHFAPIADEPLNYSGIGE
jgi:hypothetical protein